MPLGAIRRAKFVCHADALKIDVNMRGVLAKCGVFDDVDPNEVMIGGCDN